MYEIIIPNEECEEQAEEAEEEEEEDAEEEFIITQGDEHVKGEDEEEILFVEEELLEEGSDDLIEEVVDECGQSSQVVKIIQKPRKKRLKKVREKRRPYVCEDCGKTWSTRGGLKEHMIIHSGKTLPYQLIILTNPSPLQTIDHSSAANVRRHSRTSNAFGSTRTFTMTRRTSVQSVAYS